MPVGISKPHYQCNKSECLQELAENGQVPKGNLTVPELRVLLRENRRQRGLLPEKNRYQTIMDEIKNAKRDTLRDMCMSRDILFGPKSTVGELRLMLRQWVVASGDANTVHDIGVHKGATFQELMTINPNYAAWAVEEVQRSSDPDWRLMQFANWVVRMQSGEMDAKFAYMTTETSKEIQEQMNKPLASSSKDKMNVDAIEHPHTEEMLQAMKAMQMKIHELEQKVETNKDQTVNKNRKTSTTPSFEVVKENP